MAQQHNYNHPDQRHSGADRYEHPMSVAKMVLILIVTLFVIALLVLPAIVPSAPISP